MPRAVPRQVVALIDKLLPDVIHQVNNPKKELIFDWTASDKLAAIVDLVDEIPDELLILKDDQHNNLVASVAAIRNSLAMWRVQGNVGALGYMSGLSKLNPVTLIRQALLECTDEYPILREDYPERDDIPFPREEASNPTGNLPSAESRNQEERMKVFISWSGDLSHKVARVLRDWIPLVIQAVDPYLSSDIKKGERWFLDISKMLDQTSYGIICVVPGNVGEPWLNFEAGALSKSLNGSRVSPFLFGLTTSVLEGPLTQFQATIFDKEDLKKLVQSINDAFQSKPLSEEKLAKQFEALWGRLEGELNALLHFLPERELEDQEGEGNKAMAEAKGLELDDLELNVLNILGGEEGPVAIFDIADTLDLSTQRAIYHVEILEDKGYLRGAKDLNGFDACALTSQGRTHLVEKGLI